MGKKVYIIMIPVVIIGILIAVYALGSRDKAEWATTQDFVMDTLATQKLYGSNGEAGSELMKRLSSSLSMYVDGSEIDRVNGNAGKEYTNVSKDTFEIIKKARELSEHSEGLFDITIAPVTKLWGINNKDKAPTVPKDEDINAALALVNIERLELSEENDSVMLLDENMMIDLGGIAKGYACDKLYELYSADKKIKAGIASFGSSILLYGEKPDNSPFNVAINSPHGENQFLGIAKMKAGKNGKFISTSGGYERFFEVDGKKYHHIFDATTGMPADTDLISVTVIADNGTVSDYLSTLLFIKGKDSLLQYMDKYGIIAVDADNNVYISDDLKDDFDLDTDLGFKLGELQ